MRPILASLAILIATNRLSAQDPMAIIDKAVRTMADSEERLARQKCVVQSGKGTYATVSGEIALSREAQFAFPDRLRYSGTFGRAPQTQKFLFVVSGLKAWAVDGLNPVRSLEGPEYQTFRDELHFHHVLTLLPLKDKSMKVTLAPSANVEGKMAFGVLADKPGMPPVLLYFDPAGKLVKANYRSSEAGVPLEKEYLFAGYKEFDGIQKPTRVIVNRAGKKAEDWTFDSYSFPKSIPDSTFAKP